MSEINQKSRKANCGELCSALDECAFLTRYIKGIRDRFSESAEAEQRKEWRFLYQELGCVDYYVRRISGRISKYLGLKEREGEE